MLQLNLENKAVLITGGTKGIGLAAALHFASAGAQCYLTYKWGSDDFSPLYAEFEKVRGKKPVLIQADASVNEDTDNLLKQIADKEKKIDIFVSNVAFGQKIVSLADYKKSSFYKTLDYSTWPLIEYTRKIKEVFKSFPKYIVGVSSDGPDHYYTGYDYIAASKSLLEFFAKYLSVHVFKEGSRVNVLRFGPVKTESFTAIFGEEFFKFVKDKGFSEDFILTADECGKAILGLCSGFFDGMNGQIIAYDKGLPFQDNLMMQYLASKDKK